MPRHIQQLDALLALPAGTKLAYAEELMVDAEEVPLCVARPPANGFRWVHHVGLPVSPESLGRFGRVVVAPKLDLELGNARASVRKSAVLVPLTERENKLVAVAAEGGSWTLRTEEAGPLLAVLLAVERRGALAGWAQGFLNELRDRTASLNLASPPVWPAVLRFRTDRRVLECALQYVKGMREYGWMARDASETIKRALRDIKPKNTLEAARG